MSCLKLTSENYPKDKAVNETNHSDEESSDEESSEYEEDEEYSDDESLDTKVQNNKVNVLIQDLDKESLMMVMKFISDSKLKHSFQCGIIEYNDFEPHHQFGFGEEYDPGEGGQNEMNQEFYMITYIRDNDKLPKHMESYVNEFLEKAKENKINYENVLDEDEMETIISKAKNMKYE
jgi:hypothetical protein